MSRRIHRFQVVWWGWRQSQCEIDYDTDYARWGIVRWNRLYRRVGLHRSVHIWRLEIRLWAMTSRSYERVIRKQGRWVW